MEYELVYKSEYITNFWNPPNKILRTIWTTPIDMLEEVYRQEVLSHLEITGKFGPHGMLVDTKNAYYNIMPETQDWINQKFVGLVAEIGLKKMAWIVSEDFFAQISFDQFMDDATDQQALKVQYFTTDEEATEWLLQ
ncbi:hypothetical protein [Flammeovirga aprica]|uniref:STAS/SEC14 domain-containing protein n=1 Tax=Flammeovirga aprica JL-4 TaxID=694437 RepID=A0A7X9XB55_9BACT|nr:hypothetical protein [Flammeovirga aprica]NME70288.1 hypothetical protein [Flammeovirga aprica JL-4]